MRDLCAAGPCPCFIAKRISLRTGAGIYCISMSGDVDISGALFQASTILQMGDEHQHGQRSRHMTSCQAMPLSKIRSVAGTCLALILTIWPCLSLATPVTAVATSDFLDSVGVVTRFRIAASRWPGRSKWCAVAASGGSERE